MNFMPIDIANASIQMGDLETALDMLNQHLATTQNDDDARRLRAGVLARTPGHENVQLALADLQALTAPTLDDLVQRAALYERSSDFASAMSVLQTALASAPGSPPLVERALRLLSRLGLLEDARALAASMPAHWTWSQWAADLAAQASDDSTAIDLYILALSQMPPHPDTHVYLAGARARLQVALAQAEERAGILEKAAAHYAAARTVLVNDSTVTFREALVQAKLGALDVAVALARSALDDAPEILRESMLAELNNDDYVALKKRLS